MQIAACLALLAAGTACSIKEDRGPCPCYLQVSFTDPDATGEAELLGWRDDRLFRDRIRLEEARPAWTKPVPKGMLTVSACTGIREAFAEGHQMRIPPGSEADSLYAWFGEVDATGDMAYAQVTFRKQFATVFLDIRKDAEGVRSCRFLVEGNSCGFDLLDFSPVAGKFRCEPVPDNSLSTSSGAGAGTIVTFRIPRQGDTGLAVTIQPEGSAPTRFPLGIYIDQLGYSWKTEELQDIYVSIDLARGLADVRVEDWEEGTVFPLIEQ
jgi:hypothetical protein